jgi:hypothetical protein
MGGIEYIIRNPLKLGINLKRRKDYGDVGLD